MAGQNTSEIPVDQSRISPVHPSNPVRRNSLEQHLQNRPNRSDLVQSKFSIDSIFAYCRHLKTGKAHR